MLLTSSALESIVSAVLVAFLCFSFGVTAAVCSTNGLEGRVLMLAAVCRMDHNVTAYAMCDEYPKT